MKTQVRTVKSVLAAAIGACLSAPVLAQDQGAGLEEIVVTGSYIRRPSQFDSPSPLVTVTREDLDALGVNEISDVIEDLTINTGSQNNPDAFTQNFSTGTSNVNLRGLGVASTLVLINGRRQTQSAVATDRGENFVDTSSLPPMIAFERVEMLKDGATSLYGSEAVAGVVNFLTRTDFEGFELELHLQTVDGYPQEDSQISGLWGGTTDNSHFLAAFSVLDRQPLSTADRRLSNVGDDLSQAGNPGSFLIPSLPGNPAYASVWTAAFDSNLNGVADALEPQLGLPAVPGAQLPVFADQDCTAIAAQDPKAVPGLAAEVPSPIGNIPLGLCQFDFGDFYSLVPEEQRATVYFDALHDFSDRLRGRVEVHMAKNEATRNNSPSFPFAAFPTVSATHPDNPYGTNVNFIGRIRGAGGVASPSYHDSDTWRFAASLIGDINDTWGWETGVTLSENDFEVRAVDVLIDRFGLAMQGLGGPGCDPASGVPGTGNCMYFNPFGSALTGSGTQNSAALFTDIEGQFSYQATSELATVDAHVSGAFGELGGGAVGVAAGVQFRKGEIAYDYDANSNANNYLFFNGNPDFAGDRDIAAVFVEFALPLSATFDMQLAARYEDYGDGVDSTDPKISMLWRPSDLFSLRGSYGTSFRAPSLFQSFGVQTSLSELVDPAVGIPQFFPVRSQPDPNGAPLQPEQANILNLGVSLTLGDYVEFDVDYWSFEYDEVIIQQNPQALLNAAAAGNAQAMSQIVRDPASGLLLRIDSYYANASVLDTDGVDLSVAYERDMSGGGIVSFGADATLIANYDIVDPQAGFIEGVGRRNFSNFATSTPEWHANVHGSWQRENHGFNVFLRYIDGYADDNVEPGQAFGDIGSYFTVDAQYNFQFRNDFGPALSFGAINLFNEDPPHVATNGGYDSKVHDPRGRLLYARASFSF